MKKSRKRKRKLMGIGEEILQAEKRRIRNAAHSPHVVCHKTPNYARSFFKVCVTPAGYGLAIAAVCTKHIRNTPKIRRCRYRPLGNHLARVATYGIMKVRAERGKELGEGTEAERRGRDRACKVRRETRCFGLISRYFLLFFSPLLAITICNLIASDLTFDASEQPLLFGRSRDHGVNKR